MHDTMNNRLEQEIVVFLPYPELEMFSFDKQGSLREKREFGNRSRNISRLMILSMCQLLSNTGSVLCQYHSTVWVFCMLCDRISAWEK